MAPAAISRFVKSSCAAPAQRPISAVLLLVCIVTNPSLRLIAVRTLNVGKLKITRVECSRGFAKVAVGEIALERRQVHSIEQIEHVDSEFKVGYFANGKALEYTKIRICVPGPTEPIAKLIALRPHCRICATVRARITSA